MGPSCHLLVCVQEIFVEIVVVGCIWEYAEKQNRTSICLQIAQWVSLKWAFASQSLRCLQLWLTPWMQPSGRPSEIFKYQLPNNVNWLPNNQFPGFPGGSDNKESDSIAEDPDLISGLGISPGEGNGNPLQCSCLGNPMNRGNWWATVHEMAKSRTWFSD